MTDGLQPPQSNIPIKRDSTATPFSEKPKIEKTEQTSIAKSLFNRVTNANNLASLDKLSTNALSTNVKEFTTKIGKSFNKTIQKISQISLPEKAIIPKKKIQAHLEALKTKQNELLSPHTLSSITGHPEQVDLEKLALSSTGETAEETPDHGKIFQQEFRDKNKKLFASQEALRFDTLPNLIASLETKLAHLQKKKALLSNDYYKLPIDSRKYKEAEASLNALNKEIKNTENQLARYQKNITEGATWISVAAPQTLFKNSNTPGEAKQRYVPGLTNLRVQNVYNAEGKTLSSIVRSGAITDFAHGEISLQELKDYEALVQLQKQPENAKSPNNKKLIDRYDLISKGAFDQKKLDQLVEYITHNTLIGYPGKISEKNEVLDSVALKALIGEREQALTMQFLQDLTAHLENKPADGDQIILGRSSLVAMVKPARGKHGLIVNERTEAFDMKAIYDLMDGKKIQFDLDKANNETGYIDEEGIIHLPSQLKTDNTAEEITLRTVFCNTSAQGNIENTGMQKTINEDALAKLRELSGNSEEANEIINNMEQKLNKLEEYASWNPIKKFFFAPDPFNAALDFHKAIDAVGGYGSANCYGGVDRTGYLVELKTHHVLKKELEKARNTENNTTENRVNSDSAQLREWGLQQLSDDGISLPIGHDNKGHKGFKVVRFNLEVYSTHTPEGVAKRIDHISRGVMLWLPGMEKQRVDRPDKQNYPPSQ